MRPLPPPPVAVRCSPFVGCMLVVLSPPRAAGCGGALCFALSRVVLCGAAVCGVFCVLPGAVWCALLGLGSYTVVSGAVLC